MEATTAGSEGVHCNSPALDIRRVSLCSRQLLHQPADILGSHLHTVSPSLLSKLAAVLLNTKHSGTGIRSARSTPILRQQVTFTPANRVVEIIKYLLQESWRYIDGQNSLSLLIML